MHRIAPPPLDPFPLESELENAFFVYTGTRSY